MLRSGLLFSALGVAAILGIDRMARALPSASASAPKASLASAPVPTAVPAGPVTVKVVYFGMPLAVTSTRQELFVLESPAYFEDLLDDVVEKHPIISAKTRPAQCEATLITPTPPIERKGRVTASSPE